MQRTIGWYIWSPLLVIIALSLLITGIDGLAGIVILPALLPVLTVLTIAAGAIALFAQLNGSLRSCEIIVFVVIYFWFSYFGIYLSYWAALTGRPAIDPQLQRFDSWLGFDWKAWYEVVQAHEGTLVFNQIFYSSYVVQLLFSVVVFALCGKSRRNTKMIVTLMIALLFTTAVFAVYPATGPALAAGLLYPNDLILRDLRAGALGNLQMSGIICVPSFHTVFAMTFIYYHRGLRWTFLPILFTNCSMLITIPIAGRHYIADMAGGSIVAILAILITQAAFGQAMQRWLNASGALLLPPPGAAQRRIPSE